MACMERSTTSAPSRALVCTSTPRSAAVPALRPLQHRGVHFLHGRGRGLDAVALHVGAAPDLVGLGRDLLGGGGNVLHHPLQALGGVQQALGPGALGLGLGLLGFGLGRAGRGGLVFRVGGLGGDLVDVAAQGGGHAVQGLLQARGLVAALGLQFHGVVAARDFPGRAGGLGDRPGDAAHDEHRQGQHQHQEHPRQHTDDPGRARGDNAGNVLGDGGLGGLHVVDVHAGADPVRVPGILVA
jgi:hypothetical protein